MYFIVNIPCMQRKWHLIVNLIFCCKNFILLQSCSICLLYVVVLVASFSVVVLNQTIRNYSGTPSSGTKILMLWLLNRQVVA